MLNLSSGWKYPFKQGSFLCVEGKGRVITRKLSGSLFSLLLVGILIVSLFCQIRY